jgi:hypothetical protein
MKLIYESRADYDELVRTYVPRLYRYGISLRLFPNLAVYLDTPIPGIDEATLGIQPDSEFALPFPANGYEQSIHTHILTFDEAIAAGMTSALYETVRKLQLSAVYHEMSHILHFNFFGQNGSQIWRSVWCLMGRTDPISFERYTQGDYSGIVAYEAFANYYEDVIRGRIINAPLVKYILGLMGLTVLVFRPGEKAYTKNGEAKEMDVPMPLIDGRSFLPARVFTNELWDVKLRDIYYNAEAHEVIVIGGGADEWWGD